MPLSNVTILIKTFERPDCLAQLLHSLREYTPHVPVLIADDSRQPYREEMLRQFADVIREYVVLPFDSGVAVGRNNLLARVITPYFVLCDDDFIFDERTNLNWMRDTLATTDVELLGGLFYNRVPHTQGSSLWKLLRQGKLLAVWHQLTGREKIGRFHGTYERDDTTLYAKPIDYTPPLTYCDFTHNFFMAKTDAIHARQIRWSEQQKIGEHIAFFYCAKQRGLRVATTETVGVIHQPVWSDIYQQFRGRQMQYRSQFLREQGLSRFVDLTRGFETDARGHVRKINVNGKV